MTMTLLQYMVKKRGMVKKEVNKMIGISDAFDCELVCLKYCLLPTSLPSDLYYMLLTLNLSSLQSLVYILQILTPSKLAVDRFERLHLHFWKMTDK